MTTQSAARYNVAPFQKVTINLQNVDRSNGQLFPEYEGDYFIVDACDYPVLISFVHAATNVQSALWAYPGMEITGPFKGIWLTHPLLSGAQQCQISFVLGKGAGQKHNNLGNPFASLYPPYLITTDTAVAGALNFHVPPGARYINRLDFFGVSTTLTAANYNQLNATGGVCTGPLIPGFTSTSAGTGVMTLGPGTATSKSAFDVDIPLISNCASIQINTVGTGLSLAGARVKASFQ